MTNPYDIYKELNKSNCRQCFLPSCMAFAVAIIQGQKKLTDCPHLSKESISKLSIGQEKRKTLEDDQGHVLSTLKKQVATTNLAERAKELKSSFAQNKIGINILGKEFWIDHSGELSSECHTNHWVYLPLLNYILYAKGTTPTGKWVNFGELDGATKAWAQYFSHRCEEPLRQLADAHQDLLFEILHLFAAKEMTGITNADHCIVLEPLPDVFIMINFWPQEDDFPSQLTLLFDSSTPQNIDLDSLYLVCRGLVEMFRELIVTHSKDGKLF